MRTRDLLKPILGRALAATLAIGPVLGDMLGPVAAEPAASPWVTVQASKVRLVAGGHGADVIAGVEIALGDGWKTYWRSPGDAGGVPPFFDWTGSENVKDTKVLFPAPKRLTDKAGDSAGYKGSVVFPVRIRLADGDKPATIKLKIEYGICREICVPAEAELRLDVDPSGLEPVPREVGDALSRVPFAMEVVEAGAANPSSGLPAGPRLLSRSIALDGAAPKIAFTARFPAGAGHEDAFAEASDGVYLPMPKRVSQGAGTDIGFEVDLAGLDLGELRGKTVTLTLVSDAGASEARFKID